MAKIIIDEQKINDLLIRGVEEIIEKESIIQKLKSGKKLRVKFGIDPTAPDIHLGHSVILKKLKQFQKLGHAIILIIGDFTAKIGDPTGRSEIRKPLTAKNVKQNMKNYLSQAGKIINLKTTEIHYNSEWFLKEGVDKFMELTKAGSIQQVLRRADFRKRLNKEGGDITLLEAIYPLLQGYDSVKTKADIEIGGTDQKFNLLMGRRIQRYFKIPEQDIITCALLEGLDGAKKMSKSYGNYIGIAEKPESIFRKIMSMPDNLINKYFLLLTDLKTEEITKINREMESGANPRDIKIRLAEEIVKLYHNDKEALKAKENFIKVFSKKEIPNDIQIIKVDKPVKDIIYVLLKMGAVSSKAQSWRLIKQGAIEINGKVINNPKHSVEQNDIIRAGKKYFFKVMYEG